MIDLTFTDWLMRQFETFNVLLFVVMLITNYMTTTISLNRQLREKRLYEELDEIKEEIERNKK